MRIVLPRGTYLKILDDYYEIINDPIGEGGGSMIYPAVRIYQDGTTFQRGNLYFAIKECFPLSTVYPFTRNESDEIISDDPTQSDALEYIRILKETQLKEGGITADIYQKGFRLTPILGGCDHGFISRDQGLTFHPVSNTYTVMESLEEKGKSLSYYKKEYKKLPLIQILRTTEQILLALKEVHEAGYLHLDIQAGNILIKGSLDETSDFATLIDFGCARKRMEDGKTDTIADRMIFSTRGYAAPEIEFHNDGTLRLGPEADFFSLGYLMLVLLLEEPIRPGKIYHNSTGNYIPKRRLSSLQCPKHLYENLQNIFRRALAYEPEHRYHNAEEMLTDVRELLTALTPYRSDLASVKYDAFICYKHGELDSVVAKKLQTKLEHFTVPKSISQVSPMAKKKIERVFLDEGELSSCGDMGAQINEALKNSGHLIVLCSRETKESPWVNLEIDTFLKYHDKSRVLALMTDGGEPEEIFPKQLTAQKDKIDEVCSADIRSNSHKEALKKLSGDPLLKIAAPIIGTPYDSLKQRKKIYTMKRLAAAFSVCFFVLLGFFSYIFWQSREIEEQFVQAQKNQAKYLSKTALEKYAAGDRETSLLLSLAIQPKNDNDGAVVPEQMYALNTALKPYKGPHSINYTPAYTAKITEPEHLTLSNDGSYAICVTGTGAAHFIDADTGETLWKVNSSDFTNVSDSTDESSTSDFIYGLPVSETKALLFTFHDLFCVNIKNQEMLYHIKNAYFTYDENFYSLSGKYLAAGDNEHLNFFDIEKGKMLNEVDLNEFKSRTNIEYTINTICMNEDQSKIFLGTSYTYYNPVFTSYSDDPEERARYAELSEKYFKEHKGYGLSYYDIGKNQLISLSEQPVLRITSLDEETVAVIHYEKVSEEDYKVSKDEFGASNVRDWLSVYDIKSKKEKYISGSYITTNQFCNISYFKKGKTLAYWFDKRLCVYDLAAGKLVLEHDFNSSIVATYVLDSTLCIVGFSGGHVMVIGHNDSIFRFRICEVSESVSEFYFNKSNNTILQKTGNSIVFSSSEGNPKINTLNMSELAGENYVLYEIRYYDTRDAGYRCISFYQKNVYNVNGFHIFSSSSKKDASKPIFSFFPSDENDSISSIGIGQNEEGTFLSFFTQSSSRDITFYKYNLETGKEIIKEDFNKYPTLDLTSKVIYSKDLTRMLVDRNSGFVLFDISGTSVIPEKKAIFQEKAIINYDFSTDHRFILAGEAEGKYFYIYDTINYTYQKIPVQYGQYENAKFAMGAEENIFALYNGTDALMFYDYSGRLLHQIHYQNTESSDFTFAFLKHDQYLVLVDNHEISLWDIKKEKMTSSYERESFGRGELHTLPESDYFTWKDTDITESIQADTGIVRDQLTLFYIDDKQKFYPAAHIDYGYVDLFSMEVCVSETGDAISYCKYYNYKQLKEMALSVLDGQELTQNEMAKYFIQ